MQDAIRVVAGDCTVTYEDRDGGEDRTLRGRVVTLVKPDGTVLVHDADGYRPAAWLTRADATSVVRDGDAVRVAAGSDTGRLRVECDRAEGRARFAVSPAGPPVGACPYCEAALVREPDAVTCVGCRRRYPIPRDATVLDEACDACGLPRIRVERGGPVAVCADRDCESIDAAVAARFDGAWPCPDCESTLAVRRDRGLRAACPDCGWDAPVPAASVTGTCTCGLPLFGEGDDRRCLDPGCDAGAP